MDLYLSAKKENKEIYLDAFEIEDLLDYLEDTDDFTYYEEIVRLGLSLHPDNFYIRLKEARLFIINEEYQKALDLLTFLKEEDPLNEDINLLTMECYCYLNRYNEVTLFFDQMEADKDELLEEAYEYIGTLANDLENYIYAQSLLARGLSLFPDNQVIHHELCFALESAEDIPMAIELCEQLLDQAPYNYDFWCILGRLYTQENEYEKAIEAFDFAATCHELEVEIKVMKAYCLYMNGSYERAIEEYQELLDNPDTKRMAIPFLAECHIQQGNIEKAYDFLKSLIEQDHKFTLDPSAYITFIHCCLLMNKNEEAESVIQKAEEAFKDNILFLCFLAEMAFESGDEEKLFNYIRRLSLNLINQENKSEDFANALFELSRKMARIERYDKLAWSLGNMALKIHPYPPKDYLPSDKFDQQILKEKEKYAQDFLKFAQGLKEENIDIDKVNISRMFSEHLLRKNIPASSDTKTGKGAITSFIRPIDLANDFINDKNNSN